MAETEDRKGRDKDYDIIVNGDPFTVESEQVTFEQIVNLAYPVPPSPETRFTMTFFDAKKPKEGALKAGGTVLVKKKGTTFNVKPTVTS